MKELPSFITILDIATNMGCRTINKIYDVEPHKNDQTPSTHTYNFLCRNFNKNKPMVSKHVHDIYTSIPSPLICKFILMTAILSSSPDTLTPQGGQQPLKTP